MFIYSPKVKSPFESDILVLINVVLLSQSFFIPLNFDFVLSVNVIVFEQGAKFF